MLGVSFSQTRMPVFSDQLPSTNCLKRTLLKERDLYALCHLYTWCLLYWARSLACAFHVGIYVSSKWLLYIFVSTGWPFFAYDPHGPCACWSKRKMSVCLLKANIPRQRPCSRGEEVRRGQAVNLMPPDNTKEPTWIAPEELKMAIRRQVRSRPTGSWSLGMKHSRSFPGHLPFCIQELKARMDRPSSRDTKPGCQDAWQTTRPRS